MSNQKYRDILLVMAAVGSLVLSVVFVTVLYTDIRMEPVAAATTPYDDHLGTTSLAHEMACVLIRGNGITRRCKNHEVVCYDFGTWGQCFPLELPVTKPKLKKK